MINMEIIKSILSSYSIDEFIFIEEKDFDAIIISSMKYSLPLERWINLENVLKEYIEKNISILPLSQAKKYLGEKYLAKGVIVKWVTQH